MHAYEIYEMYMAACKMNGHACEGYKEQEGGD